MRHAALAMLASAALLLGAPARADEAIDGPDRDVEAAMREGPYTFCKKPRAPLFERQRDLCSFSDVEGCEGFAEACRTAPGESLARGAKSGGAEWLSALAPLAKALLYLLVVGIVLAIAIPIVSALRRARRGGALAKAAARSSPAVATALAPEAVPLEEISDAEAALQMAEEHRRRGELGRALALYLAASLTALDRRGAIRIAKHRTNGEYVRFCTEEDARPPLRDIVREVDKAQFGKIAPSEESVTRVAARATALVRRTAAAALVALAVLACGCSGGGGLAHDDPAGDELPLEVLRRQGFEVAPLGRSIASVPIPEDDAEAPGSVIVVDVDRVPLSEEETQAHLMRWLERGGVLVLFGDPSGWPRDLGASPEVATEREIVFDEYDLPAPPDDEEDEGDSDEYVKVREIRGRVALPRAASVREASTIARLGPDAYVVRKFVGRGILIGVASDDLFTNVGVLPKHNAAVLVGIFRLATRDARLLQGPSAAAAQAKVKVQHARREDAIPPPSTPFAALLAAGLGKGAWHALGAAVVLFLAFGIRHARAKRSDPPARRAFAEHVEATGTFWGRAKALPHALSAYGRFVEMRLRERVPRGADPVQFLATRANVPTEHAARLYERATSAKDDDEVRGDELRTIAELRALLVKALEAG